MMDREKVISKLQILRTWCAVNPDYDTGLSAEDCVKAVGWLDNALALLKAQEAVDAVPVVHGRWIEIEDSWGDCHYQCTECGEEWNLDAGTPEENNMNYCPNCGAKMDGERRDES